MTWVMLRPTSDGTRFRLQSGLRQATSEAGTITMWLGQHQTVASSRAPSRRAPPARRRGIVKN